MAGFKWALFLGAFPSKPTRLMQANELAAASNVQLDRGTLRPFPATAHVVTPAATTRSIYYYRDPDDAEPEAWLAWDDFDVSVAASPVVNDTYDRLYWSGDTTTDTSGRPKVAGRDEILGLLNGPYPEEFFYLGIPPVNTTPTAARTDPVGDPDPSLASSYTYAVTYVSDNYGEEGAPSAATGIIDVDDSATFEVEITVPYEDIETNRDVGTLRLYVAYAGTSQDDWKFVKEVTRNIGTSTVITHEVAIADLVVPMVSLTWEPPPTTVRGLRAFGSGLVGYSLNELCMSESGFPHAWPVAYRLPTEHPITGIGVYGNTIFVGTKGNPYIAYGHSPSNMTIERLAYDQACVSQASIVELDDGVVYASPTGLHMVRGKAITALTTEIWSRTDFADLEPETFRAARWGNMYICQYGSTSKSMFAMYPRFPERGIVELPAQDAYGYHYDVVGDKLYYMDQGTSTIKELFDIDGADLTMTVTTGTYVSVQPTNMAWMQVEAYSYPLTVALYTNSAASDAFELVGAVETVTNRDAFRLPSGYLATAFYCVIVSNDEIESVLIAESAADLRTVR